MNIKIESNIKKVLSEFDRISNLGVSYAISNSINDVLFEMRKNMPNEIERAFDKPVPFTTNPYAWDIDKARRTDLIGILKAKPAQNEYLRWQVYGGTETPKKRAIPVPSKTSLMRADHGGLKKSWKKAFGDDKRYFTGVPRVTASGGKVDPIPGLYRRYRKTRWDKKEHRHRGGYLRMEVSFESSTNYQKKWDFYGVAAKFFEQRFEQRFRERLQEQLNRQSSKK